VTPLWWIVEIIMVVALIAMAIVFVVISRTPRA